MLADSEGCYFFRRIRQGDEQLSYKISFHGCYDLCTAVYMIRRGIH